MKKEQNLENNTEQALTKPIVGKLISLTDLKVNDLFYMTYGYGKVKFRVRAIFEEEGVFAHSLTWCKSDAILIPFSESRKIHYAGKMNKIRSWFLL